MKTTIIIISIVILYAGYFIFAKRISGKFVNGEMDEDKEMLIDIILLPIVPILFLMVMFKKFKKASRKDIDTKIYKK